MLFLSCLVVAFLPPTRTRLELLEPKGDTTVVFGSELHFKVDMRGRIPAPEDKDVGTVAFSYNPEDPSIFEEIPLEKGEESHIWQATLPARQVRLSGLKYQIFAGNTQTPEYTVTVRTRPLFERFEISYAHPAYLNKTTEPSDEPGLIGYFGTTVTITAFTNREVATGKMEVDGDVNVPQGVLVPGNPNAIRFTYTLRSSTEYTLRFTTPQGERNEDVRKNKISVLDPFPGIDSFDIAYDYPAYRRWQPQKVSQKQGNVEAVQGTTVKIVAHANRPVKEATLTLNSKAPEAIAGQLVQDDPLAVSFTLPKLDRTQEPFQSADKYRIRLVPTTGEKPLETSEFLVRIIPDDPPVVHIKQNLEGDIGHANGPTIPKNGSLVVEGKATDDVGVASILLRMEAYRGKDKTVLTPRHYRGKSLKRDADGTYPTDVDYNEVVPLGEMKAEGLADKGFKLQPGDEVEYWLEATDNCEEPKPQTGESERMRFKVGAEVDPKEVARKRQEAQKKKEAHDKQQEQQFNKEQRQPQQPQRRRWEDEGAAQATPAATGGQSSPRAAG